MSPQGTDLPFLLSNQINHLFNKLSAEIYHTLTFFVCCETRLKSSWKGRGEKKVFKNRQVYILHLTFIVKVSL